MKYLLCLLLCGCTHFDRVYGDAGVLDADTSGFSVFDDAPDGGAWRGVWGSSADDVHVVGEGGRVLAWDGAQVVRPNLGAGNDLYGVWGSAQNDLWAVGENRATQGGVIFHKTAQTWVQFGTTKFGLRSVWGAGDMRYAAGNSGAVYSGPTATPFASGMQIDANPNVPVTPNAPLLYAVGGNNAMSVMIAGDVDSTYFFDTRWHAFEDPIDRTRAFRAIWGAPGDTVSIFEGANYFGLWHFTSAADPVVTLNEEKISADDFNKTIWSIWGVDDQRIVAVGDEGRIMTWDAATQAVVVRQSPTTRALYGVWGSSFDDLWIVGDGGLILRGKIAF
jgi:hypothetical protein